jgi:pyrroline-5-carboxylate reductase
MQTNLKIAFIGGGNMAQALISGLADKLIPASQIHVVDVHAETLHNVEKKWGVSTAAAAGAEVAAASGAPVTGMWSHAVSGAMV